MKSVVLAAVLLIGAIAQAQTTAPATTQPLGKLPFIDVDVKQKTVRVECEALRVQVPLEFFACVAGGPEHESVLRSKARPSHLHLALVMLGLEPGRGVHYDEATKKWVEPSGPKLKLSVEFEKDGKLQKIGASELMRDIKTKKAMPAEARWVFTGSKIMPDKTYGADRLGYLISIVNFELAPIDTPKLASNKDDTLEWQLNPDTASEAETKVTLIIEPDEQKQK
jgi:hypothetical protein